MVKQGAKGTPVDDWGATVLHKTHGTKLETTSHTWLFRDLWKLDRM